MSASATRKKHRSPAKKDQFLVYLAPGQGAAVTAAARSLGMSNSEFARRALAAACDAAVDVMDDDEFDEIEAGTYDRLTAPAETS